MQATERDKGSPGAIVIGQLIGPPRRSDVDLNHHQVWLIAEVERLDMLILKRHLIFFAQIRRQRCQAERRKQGVFDGAKERAVGFC